MNFSTFAELAFHFRITPPMVLGMAFALAMGAAGGLLPAFLAAHRPIVQSLRGPV